jgi:two-component system chemotaxis response regulator CheY
MLIGLRREDLNPLVERVREAGLPHNIVLPCRSRGRYGYFDSRHAPGGTNLIDVMIVDDSAAIRKILRRVLDQADVPVDKVHEAGDGLEALELLKSNSVQLILCDINMPNMDGLQLLEHLKAKEPLRSVPVIMVTTEGSQARVLKALELGAAGYVKKPFTAAQIKEKLTGIV